MRIVHVIASLDPAHGGPPMIAARIAAAQAIAGHDVNLVCYQSHEERSRVAAALDAVPGFGHVRIVALPPADRSERFLARRARTVLRDVLRDPCAVHLHGVWDAILRAAGAEADALRRPYFILLNGMLDPWSLSQSAWKKRLALALGYRAMLDRAAGLHVGNDDERRLIEPLRLRAPSYVIPNGVFLEELEPLPPPGAFHEAHPALGGRPYALFLSRLHFKKGLDYLADAFARVATSDAQVMLVVAGPDGGEREPFEQRVASLGITDRVYLPGPLYGRDKLAALSGATCFCLPSRQEGFSIAITEALACGVPVVASENCHFPEVASSGAGAIVQLDAADVAAALSRYVSDAAARAAAGAAGRRLVAERFTWGKIAEQTIEMYRAGAAVVGAPIDGRAS
jgi:glycosyltransferase involved in cell wall biosynthesis